MADMSEADSATLARIDERTRSQADAFTAHVKVDAEASKDTNDKFQKVFDFVSKRFDKVDERFDDIMEKLEPLQNESNQRKGAVGLSRILSGGIYAIIALAAGYFGGVSHK